VTERFDTIVIGGGIAGVAALAEVARFGSAVLVEREASLAAHASGRNAAIYRPLEFDHTTAVLARRSLEILAELTNEPILRRVGLLLVAQDASRVEAAARHARDVGVAHAVLNAPQCGERATALLYGDVAAGLYLPDAGVLDIHRIITTLAGTARDRGAQILHRAGVEQIETQSGRATGVRLEDGTAIVADRVVIAAGAWASALGRQCGSPVALTPMRRHLMLLNSTLAVDRDGPVVWRIDPLNELYFRPESGGVLASPCDATAVTAGPTPVDRNALELLAVKLARTSPTLARAQVQQAWACLRTFAPDGELVVGADPHVTGLYWLAGLGGRGMAVAVGAAEALGTLVASGGNPASHPMGAALSPARP